MSCSEGRPRRLMRSSRTSVGAVSRKERLPRSEQTCQLLVSIIVVEPLFRPHMHSRKNILVAVHGALRDHDRSRHRRVRHDDRRQRGLLERIGVRLRVSVHLPQQSAFLPFRCRFRNDGRFGEEGLQLLHDRRFAHADIAFDAHLNHPNFSTPHFFLEKN